MIIEKYRKCKNYLVDKLNEVSLAKKLLIMQIFCVLIPLLFTDGIIWGIVVRTEQRNVQQEMENTASAVKFIIGDSFASAVILSQRIYDNAYLNDFLDRQFESPSDYYAEYLELSRGSVMALNAGTKAYSMLIYTDNESIVSGGYLRSLDMAENTEWYRELQESEGDTVIHTDYVKIGTSVRREISLIRWMNFYHKSQKGNVLKLSLDYSSMLQSIINANYSSPVYICDGDTVLLANNGRGGLQAPFEKMDMDLIPKAGLKEEITLFGKTWDIYILRPETDIRKVLIKNEWLFLFLISVNLLLPLLLMRLINRSLTERLTELELVFAAENQGELGQISQVRGHDEISSLMENYNRMAGRMNELIQTVYKNKLKSQEMDIARQKAELLALHSQINPHFLFNALESIRMHSVLKKEFETADMVQRLALMERQNVEWGDDLVCIKDEKKIIEAYLELQKYRFGAKLKYDIQIDETCEKYLIPKLTLVTFTENACVHGMEEKTAACWIFVRVYKTDQRIVMEVEDTGNGIQEEQCAKMLEEMSNVSIEMLKNHHKIGMLNAALRLKLATSNRVEFEIDSEMGAGTIVTIKIPLCAMEVKKEDHGETYVKCIVD